MEKSLLFHFRRIGVEFIIFSVYAVFSISWAATGSLMPLISNDLALNTQQATLITSMIVVAKIFGAYLGLFFKRKNISFKIMLLSGGACIFICGFCMLFLQNLVLIQIFAVLSGIFYSMWFPFFFNLPSELKISNPNQTAYIMSAFWSITFVILSFNLWVVSWSIDKTHSFTLGFVYIFALIFISAILAQFVLPRRENFIQGKK
ncbi:MFS transporter [Campylobacter jejuni]|nr:MFS transporter [Campylobacter jejuni]